MVWKIVVEVDSELMVNVSEFEIPPPGLATVMLDAPAAVISDAGTVAVNCVALTNVVVRVELFQRTAAPERKPWPLTVRVNCAPPAVAVAGVSDEIVAEDGGVIVNGKFAEVLLVPDGLVTPTVAVPAEAISVAGTTAVSWLALTKVVTNSEPFHNTVAPVTKLLPLAESVNCGPPAAVVKGDNDVRFGVFAAPMVNVSAFEVVVPVITVTLAVPAVVSSAFETEACSCVALVTMVTNGLPFHCTVEAEVKPVPVTVRMKLAPPGVVDAGESVVMVGPVGAAMENVKGAEVWAEVPELGVLTVTLAEPTLAIRPAGTFVDNCMALMNVVGSNCPFHKMAELELKFEPFTVKVKFGPPGAAEDGLSDDNTGVGVDEMMNG